MYIYIYIYMYVRMHDARWLTGGRRCMDDDDDELVKDLYAGSLIVNLFFVRDFLVFH